MVFPTSQVWARAGSGASVWRSRQWQTEHALLDFTDAIARFIDLSTFSSAWYWFVVVVTWALASHWLIGVPFDLLFRARKAEGEPMEDLQQMVEINVRRITYFDDLVGTLAIALGAFVVAGIGMMGFFYGVEIAQGAFVLLAPLSFVGLINLRLAQRLRRTPLYGRDLVSHLFKVRMWTQVIGAISLFVTAVYGMYFNIEQTLFF